MVQINSGASQFLHELEKQKLRLIGFLAVLMLPLVAIHGVVRLRSAHYGSAAASAILVAALLSALWLRHRNKMRSSAHLLLTAISVSSAAAQIEMGSSAVGPALSIITLFAGAVYALGLRWGLLRLRELSSGRHLEMAGGQFSFALCVHSNASR